MLPCGYPLRGDAHAMLELTHVLPPCRVEDAGLGRAAVAMADASAGDDRSSD